MIANYNRKSLMFGVPGLAIQIVCVVAINMMAAKATSNGPMPSVGLIALAELGVVAGDILLIVGLCFYAKAKGYSPFLGLLGLLSCIGLLVLAVLPDKTKGMNDGAPS
jgi:hypothetical protein